MSEWRKLTKGSGPSKRMLELGAGGLAGRPTVSPLRWAAAFASGPGATGDLGTAQANGPLRTCWKQLTTLPGGSC